MYPNLNAEMARRGLTQREIAPLLGIKTSTLSLKFNGKSGFSLKEAAAIKKILRVDLSLEYLFEQTKDTA